MHFSHWNSIRFLEKLKSGRDVSFSDYRFILLSATAKAVVGVTFRKAIDISSGAWHFTPSVRRVTTAIVVESPNPFTSLSGFSCFAMNGHLCITVFIWSLTTDLSAALPVSRVSYENSVFTTTSPPWTCAAPAGSGSRHMKSLPPQVVHGVFVVTRHEEFLGQMAGTVEQGEAVRFSCLLK